MDLPHRPNEGSGSFEMSFISASSDVPQARDISIAEFEESDGGDDGDDNDQMPEGNLELEVSDDYNHQEMENREERCQEKSELDFNMDGDMDADDADMQMYHVEDDDIAMGMHDTWILQ